MSKKELKERASFTFDKKTLEILEKLIQSDEYRNKSHVIESAIKLLGKDKLEDKKEKRGEK